MRDRLRRHDDSGFTLVELLVVIVVIGILAAIAIPVFLNQRNKAWDTDAKSDMYIAVLALKSEYAFSTDGMPTDATVMQRAEPSVTWLSSSALETSNPPVGVVAWERAQVGNDRDTAVLGIRSRSNRCLYARIIETPDSGLPLGVTYYSEVNAACPDPWLRTGQITGSSY